MLLYLVQFFSGSCEFKIGFLIIATIVEIELLKVHLDDRYSNDQSVESGFDMIATSVELFCSDCSDRSDYIEISL